MDREKQRGYDRKWRLLYAPLHYIWSNMRQRCYNSKVKAYANYGGRGIVICPQWKQNYKQFESDIARLLGPRPLECTLDRIDNDGNYEPSNVRWATRKMQRDNSRLVKN